MRYIVTLLFLALATQAQALSVDISALSSSKTRQFVGNAKHLEMREKGQFEVSGQYVATQGKENVWDAGIESVHYLPYFDWGLQLENDMRYYHDRSTFSGGLGYAKGWVSLSAGFRTEYPNDTPKETYGKLAGVLRGKVWPFAISAKGEYLHSDFDKRFDYRAEAKVQFSRFYVGFKAEEIKYIELQAVSVGISF